jgi:poly-D-alanine transfer protein DltD
MEGDGSVVFIDSSVLISCGRRESTRFQALAREARQRDTVFRISPQVYAEVTSDPALDAYISDTAVDDALQEGWMKVTESPSYSESEISTVMDQTRNFIASSSNRAEDVVEKADTEIVGLALEMLLDGTTDRVIIVTNDIPLGEAAESLIPKYGFDDEQIMWLTGGELADEIAEDFVPEFE